MNDGRPDSALQPRSAAQQVVQWVRLASLVVAVSTMGAGWIAAALPMTASTALIFVFATVGLWVTVYRLLILGIKRVVRSRVAQSKSGSA